MKEFNLFYLQIALLFSFSLCPFLVIVLLTNFQLPNLKTSAPFLPFYPFVSHIFQDAKFCQFYSVFPIYPFL